MTFDLRSYAREHRLRVRNLHDGRSVATVGPASKSRAPAYRGNEDRLDAIVGRRGHVTMERGRLYVFLAYPTVRAKHAGMKRLLNIGVKIEREGDAEIGGTAPVELIGPVLQEIRVHRLRPGAAGFRERLA